MADRGEKQKRSSLPWGMSAEGLKPNSVQSLTQNKLKAFSLGRTIPVKKANPFMRQREEREEKKRIEAKEAAHVFEQFVASFDEPTKSVKAFVRGSTINPATSSESSSSSATSQIYKPTSKFLQKVEKKDEPSESSAASALSITKKPPKKKGTDKKKSILELFREELKRAQEERKERHDAKQKGEIPLDAPETTNDIFKVDEYRDFMRGSYDTGDPLTTNLYVGNINPKMNEEMLCQVFGKFGPLASVKVMWPRTEEEKARNRNCGFVAYMNRADADKALEAMKGSTIMEFKVQIGWGKAVPLPPHPIYVPPNMKEEEESKLPDPPSGFPFNAQKISKREGRDSRSVNIPPPGAGGGKEDDREESFEELLYNSLVRVVIPTDLELLQLIHRMIEFVIREGPMFEAMIMNRELNNPLFQFLFDNQSPAHVYYRWKLFSILQGDSPETWRTDEFRMFENGSVWKPPPLRKLRSKVLPPVIEEVTKKGQLTLKRRDELEDMLRSISMERDKVKTVMVWCLDHAESADEIVDCVSEALCITETPLPMKIARLYLVSDILQNSSVSVPNASNFRRGFEAKLLPIMEHFHTVYSAIPSRIRGESFKRRILACLRAWDQTSVYHFNLIDKLRETFIGKTQEELEKMKAFETVAALISEAPEEGGGGGGDLDGLPLMDDRPIDFSLGTSIDGVPLMEDLDGEPLADPDLDGVPLAKEGEEGDIDGVPMEEDPPGVGGDKGVAAVRSKWELVDYGDDSDEEETRMSPVSPAALGGGEGGGEEGGLSDKQRKELLAELDERKRKILREVELKVMELSDALEAGGSYSKAEITERLDKYRDKLLQEAVEPKRSPPPSPTSKPSSSTKAKSRSPSPTTLAKYSLNSSSPSTSKNRSPDRSRKRSKSPEKSRKRSRSPEKPRKRSRSPSPSSKRRRSNSPSRKKHRSSRSPSPKLRKSRSRSPSSRKTKHSSSPKRRSSPARKRSRSRSPRRRSRSRSPKRRSRSPSPGRRKHSRSRSRSPRQSSGGGRHRSRSPHPHRHRSRSRSPKSRKSSRKSRSRSPHKSSKSKKSKH